jgi:hypothetical protein
MDTLQAYLDGLSAGAKAERSDDRYLNLGDLIDKLRVCPLNYLINIDNCDGVGDISSYRGYYEDCAIEPSIEVGNVGSAIAKLEAVLNTELTGYKGGEYLMKENTPLWISPYGENAHDRVKGININDDNSTVTIETENAYND